MQNERPLFSAPTKITRWPSITGGPNSHHSDNALGHRVLCICAFTWLIPALLASTKFLTLLPWVLAGHWGVTVVTRVGDTGKTLRCLSYPMGERVVGRLVRHLTGKICQMLDHRKTSLLGWRVWHELVWYPKTQTWPWRSPRKHGYYLLEQHRAGDERAVQSNVTRATTRGGKSTHVSVSSAALLAGVWTCVDELSVYVCGCLPQDNLGM